MLKISPTALKAFMACPRSWWLSHIKRAPKEVPAYVMGGRDLDQTVQNYLTDGTVGGSSSSLAELDASKPYLPTPGTVVVQPKLSWPCPGLEGIVQIEGTLDALTPPNLDLMVVLDMKRIWAPQAAMTPEQLLNDVQFLTYAWLTRQIYNPAVVVGRWVYCVRETRNKETGKITRKAKAFSVDQWADRDIVDAWFDRIVLPAARAMLEVMRALEAAEVEHDPTSCEEGARCFVRHHCPMYQGPVKGESNIMVDLSRFKTGKVPSLAEAVASGVHTRPSFLDVQGPGAARDTRIAINPPALVSPPSPIALAAAEQLDVTAIEGPGAALLAVEDEPEAARESSPTEPAPPPAVSEPEAVVNPAPKARTRRSRTLKAAATAAPADSTRAIACEAEKQGLSVHEAEAFGQAPTVEAASTEALVWELRDRGYTVRLRAGAL